MEKKNLASTLDVAVGSSAKSTNWKNRKITWPDLVRRLQEPSRTSETAAEYRQLSRSERAAIKDAGGGFVGGFIEGGRRLKGNIRHRQIIALDADFASADTWVKFTDKFPVAACCYSTHSHTQEQPKLRIIFPVSRPLDLAEYMALSRYVAGEVGIEDFDPTTFAPERLMYWPSCSKDGVFFSAESDGDILDADEILSRYTDWRDSSSWPTSERESADLRNLLKKQKQADPTAKDNIVGLFCRAFSIQDAIERFLKDKYEEGEAGRYTFIGGTSANGLVIYEDKWAYSHHGTDPASGLLCNAFDLVRIHLYGELDKDSEEKNGKRPSVAAMADFASELKEVKKQKRRDAESEFEAYAEEAEEADSEDWATRLSVSKAGEYEQTVDNFALILQHDPNLCERFQFNLFSNRNEINGIIPWPRNVITGPQITDADFSELQIYIEQHYGGLANKGKLADALDAVVVRNSYHPVREYLNSVKWDGRSRIETLFIDYLGAEDSPYVRLVTRKMFLGAVARIFVPGIKFDWVLTLVGKQGIGKSTIFKQLASKEWFSELKTIEGDKATEKLTGHWFLELGELAALNRVEVERYKEFFSTEDDIYRKPWGRFAIRIPRQCIFVGTTNVPSFLRGSDGNRRFWPVDCCTQEPLFDVQDISEETRSQLWAEAVQIYRSGESLQLPANMEEIANGIQADHTEQDERTGIIGEYLERLLPEDWEERDATARSLFLAGAADIEGTVKRDKVCVAEICIECLGSNVHTIKRADSLQIASVLRSLGWEAMKKVVRFPLYGVNRGYQRVTKVTR